MIYDYKVTTGTGEELNLADYNGKVRNMSFMIVFLMLLNVLILVQRLS